MRNLSDLLRKFVLARFGLRPLSPLLDVVNEQYVASPPTVQNVIDIFKGRWISAFPPSCSLVSGGTIPLFNDARIEWLLQRYGGSLEGKSVAELGPFEGGHSYMLSRAGAAHICAIEANTINYTKTLIVKEIFDLDKVTLLCGEIEGWLAETQDTFDLMVASGVLYHFKDPLLALYNMTRKARVLFIWTHFIHDTSMPKSDVRFSSFTGETSERTVDGFTCRYFRRSYAGAEYHAAFCGGVSDESIWLSRDAIVNSLRHWSFDVEELMIESDHANGPCACFFAQRREPVSTADVTVSAPASPLLI